MSQPLSHLVFYDGNCGLCDKVVRLLYQEDKKKLFVFAPLQGETASHYLKSLPPEIRFSDSMILIENYKSPLPRIRIYAKAALRIAWLLGWPWILVGWLSILPGWLFDWIYKIIAANRHHLFPNDQCFIPPPDQKQRFLP